MASINDGKGIFDKYGMIDEMARKMDVLADAKGAFRGGLIWDVTQRLKALADGLKKEDEENRRKVEELKRIIEEAK